MKKIRLMVFFFLICFASQAQVIKDPVYNFNFLWADFKENYKMFPVKKINWDSLYDVYRVRITAKTSDKDLFVIMSQLMSHLNDSHCWLDNGTVFYKSGTNVTYALKDWDLYWTKYHVGNFSMKLIETNYLLSKKFKSLQQGDYKYGWLNDSIGYFHFDKFENPLHTNSIMDSILTEFKFAKGLIIDIRSNSGGDNNVGKIILDRFADTRRLYMIEDSAAYNLYYGDRKYGKKRYAHTEPRGKIRFANSVVVLTDKTSYSSADILATGFKEMNHATLVGDTTNGCTAYMFTRKLPNGWAYTIAMSIAYTAEGKCLDGIGVSPDILIQNSSLDITQGVDKVLERAIAEVKTKTFARVKREDYSVLNKKTMQVDEKLLNYIYDNESDSAIRYIESLQVDQKEKLGELINERYTSYAGWDCLDAGQIDLAMLIFKFNNNVFPYAPNTLLDLSCCFESRDKNVAMKYRSALTRLDANFKYDKYVPYNDKLKQLLTK